MNLKWIDGALVGLITSVLMVAWLTPKYIEQQVHHKVHSFQNHTLCQSTEKQRMWVGIRGNERRCFAIRKTYPNRVTSWHLPEE